jgi:hypothetical protein
MHKVLALNGLLVYELVFSNVGLHLKKRWGIHSSGSATSGLIPEPMLIGSGHSELKSLDNGVVVETPGKVTVL